MAQWVRTFATKLKDQISIPGTYTVGGEKQLLEVVLGHHTHTVASPSIPNKMHLFKMGKNLNKIYKKKYEPRELHCNFWDL